MKLISKLVLLNLLCFTVSPVVADSSSSEYHQQETSTNMKKLVEYFQNLGNYFGFDVTHKPNEQNQNYSMKYTLLNLPVAQLAQTYLFYTYLGSIPVNTYTSSGATSGGTQEENSDPFALLVPNEIENAKVINSQVNNSFKGYNTVSTDKVSVSNLIDQQTYQKDPVSQAILNILGTPDFTYCMESANSDKWKTDCNLLYEYLVTSNVVGNIPSAKDFFSPNYIQQFADQLNSNALTGPLMYSTQGLPQTGNNQQNNGKPGLAAQNQAQLAANFIRYVTGGAIPLAQPSWNDYNALYTQLKTTPENGGSVEQQKVAEAMLSKYLAAIRTYAAQNSVSVSNFYYLMSKRMPQSASDNNKSNQMSQALSEFNMATWRLFNPSSKGAEPGASGNATGQPDKTQWINQLNNAAPPTVEKEIALLLAEINYQLYLTRQVQERILMTNSVLVLGVLRTGAPSSNLGSSKK
jgi:intracellular multiplication protein IcmX